MSPSQSDDLRKARELVEQAKAAHSAGYMTTGANEVFGPLVAAVEALVRELEQREDAQ